MLEYNIVITHTNNPASGFQSSPGLVFPHPDV